METCRQNKVDPQAYLADVLARLPTHPNRRIKELLPHYWQPSQTLTQAA
ncbi:MAG: transposase domain-containing protein [Alphaproteobacteria bacterium]|nr:transposase domain-containing protein [Alphaproteobacteria bacterium]